MDPSLASTTMLYGLACRRLGRRAARRLRHRRETACRASRRRAPWRERSRRRGAALTGLPAGHSRSRSAPATTFANPLGAGIAAPGTVAVTLGTGEAISALAERPVLDPERLVETHAYPTGHFNVGNPGWLSGGAVTWFLDTFSVADAAAFSRLAAEAPPGCDGLLFLPALSGAMAPRWIASARAGFVGATAGARQGAFRPRRARGHEPRDAGRDRPADRARPRHLRGCGSMGGGAASGAMDADPRRPSRPAGRGPRRRRRVGAWARRSSPRSPPATRRASAKPAAGCGFPVRAVDPRAGEPRGARDGLSQLP